MHTKYLEASSLYLMYKNYWVHIVFQSIVYIFLTIVISEELGTKAWMWLCLIFLVQVGRYYSAKSIKNKGIFASNFNEALIKSGIGITLLGMLNIFPIVYFPKDIFIANILLFAFAGLTLASAITYGYTKYLTTVYLLPFTITIIIHDLLLQSAIGNSRACLIVLFGGASINFGNQLFQMNMQSLSTRNENKALIKSIESTNEELQRSLLESEIAKSTFDASVDYAKILQEAVFPNFEEESCDQVQIAGFNLAKSNISGIFYWINKQGQKYYLCMGDATNTGVSGSLLNSIFIQTLDQLADQYTNHLSADKMLIKLDRNIRNVLYGGSDQNMHFGADIGIICIDIEEREVQYAGVTIPFFIIENGNVQHIKPKRTSIGLHSKIDVTYFSHKMTCATKVLLINKGYINQYGGTEEKKYSLKSLMNKLESSAQLDISELCMLLNKNMLEWKEGHEMLEDVGLLGISILSDD